MNAVEGERMQPRLLVWRPSARVVVFATIALALVVAVSLLPGGWGRAYGDTTPSNAQFSSVAEEAAIGGQPNAPDTQNTDLTAGGGTFRSEDGRFGTTETGG